MLINTWLYSPRTPCSRSSMSIDARFQPTRVADQASDVVTPIHGDQRSALLGIPVVHRGLQELD